MKNILNNKRLSDEDMEKISGGRGKTYVFSVKCTCGYEEEYSSQLDAVSRQNSLSGICPGCEVGSLYIVRKTKQ